MPYITVTFNELPATLALRLRISRCVFKNTSHLGDINTQNLQSHTSAQMYHKFV